MPHFDLFLRTFSCLKRLSLSLECLYKSLSAPSNQICLSAFRNWTRKFLISQSVAQMFQSLSETDNCVMSGDFIYAFLYEMNIDGFVISTNWKERNSIELYRQLGKMSYISWSKLVSLFYMETAMPSKILYIKIWYYCVSPKKKKIIKNQFSAFIFISKASSKCFPNHLYLASFSHSCCKSFGLIEKLFSSCEYRLEVISLLANCDNFFMKKNRRRKKFLSQISISVLFTFCFNCFHDSMLLKATITEPFIVTWKKHFDFVSHSSTEYLSLSLSFSLTLYVKMFWFDIILICFSCVVIIVLRLAT